MAEYPSIVLTNAGLDMIAESQAGQSLIFTKLKIGDGLLGTGESISTLNALKSPKLDIPIQGFLNQGNGQVRLRYLVDNSGVPVNQGFFAREVGIYAKIGEPGTERLYAYTNGGNKVDWIPDRNTPMDAQIFDIFVLIGNASNVTVVINGSATYATVLDVKEHNENENAHGELITKHNADQHAHAELFRLWQSHKAYIVGDVCRPRSFTYPSWIFLECIQGGISDVFEPPWPAVGEEVTDGTVRWRVRDIKSGGGVPIGTVMPFLATQPQPGWLALDTGAMVGRDTYPQLWAWVQQYGPLISEAEWQAQAAVQSSVGYYSSGDGSTTFRLPRLVDYQRGGLAAEVGQWQGDAIRNITGTFQARVSPLEPTGVFSSTGANQSFNTGTTNYIGPVTFDPSNVVPTAEENRPKTIKFLYCVKAFDAVTDQGLLNSTALANEVAGKVNLTDFIGTNQSLTANGWQKLPGGLIMQWGQSAALGENVSATLTLPISFPNAALGGVVSGTGTNAQTVATITNITQTQVTVYSDGITGTITAAPIRYLVWGY
ncbi:hypothetical protein [Sporomusa paucivorans]|uniref:gp53-like domain-containing protein n=1 Tax=Sporomusa paucivorans TaxID=2376 RepID=UPI0035711845